MKSPARLLVTCVFVYLGTGVWCWATVVVDGTDEWSFKCINPNNDGDEAGIPDAYDIDWNYQLFDSFSNGDLGLFFIQRTIDDFTNATNPSSWAAVYLDTKPGGGTWQSRSGVDYYARWTFVDDSGVQKNFGQTYTVALWGWDQASGTFKTITGTSVQVAWNQVGGSDPYGNIEWGFKTADVGMPSVFGWFAYLDNADLPADDQCPNTDYQWGYIPEPGTGLLFLLGLAGVALMKRRRPTC